MDLPENMGLSASEQQAVHQQWSTYTGVIQQLTKEGFKALGEPSHGYPEYLDIDTLTSHDSRVLTRELARNKAWKDFAQQRLTYISMILVETRNELQAIEARVRKHLRTNKVGKTGPTKDDIVDQARTDPRYEQLKAQEQQFDQYKMYYDAEVERFSGNYALISRVITLRGQNIDEGMRQNNVGANGSGYGGFNVPPRL